LTGSNVLIDAIQRTARKYPKAFGGNNLGDQYNDLVKRLSFDTSQFSDVITLRVTMADPNIAAETANNIGFAFIEFNQKMAAESGNAAVAAIKANIDPVKKKMSELDDEIAKVKNDAGISDYVTSASGEAGSLANLQQRLADLKAQWEGAKSELASAESSLSKMDKTILQSKSEQYNPVMTQFDLDLAKAESEREGLLARYTPDAESVRDADNRIRILKEKKAKVKEQIDAQSITTQNPNRVQQELNVAQIRSKEQSLGSQITELQTAVDKFKESQTKYPDIDKKIKAFERERSVSEATYQQLQQRLDLIESTGKGRQSGARIVSTAIPPTGSPSFPDTRLFLFFGIGLGVVISAFILMPKGEVDVYGEYRPKGKAVAPRRGQPVGGRNLPAKPRSTPAETETTSDEPPPSPPVND
jgi:uncharacterized protein involved in exopolysaccharide biosynthesis